jgi:GNAT superfamily N-acetyltransferase
MLSATGWSVFHAAHTMERTLEPTEARTPPHLETDSIPSPGWLAQLSAWDREDAATAAKHRSMLERMEAGLFGAWRTPDGIAALGVLSRAGDNAFLYDMVVDPHRRRQGIGKRFLAALLDVAGRSGVARVRLQVVESNLAARTLYASMGFAFHHAYHYRLAPGCTSERC